jgi:hypothetical protein
MAKLSIKDIVAKNIEETKSQSHKSGADFDLVNRIVQVDDRGERIQDFLDAETCKQLDLKAIENKSAREVVEMVANGLGLKNSVKQENTPVVSQSISTPKKSISNEFERKENTKLVKLIKKYKSSKFDDSQHKITRTAKISDDLCMTLDNLKLKLRYLDIKITTFDLMDMIIEDFISRYNDDFTALNK